MRSKETLTNRIKGWFPQSPNLPENFTSPPEHSNENQNKPPMATQPDDSLWSIFRIIIGALLLSFGGLALVYNEFSLEWLKSIYVSVYEFGSLAGLFLEFFGIGIVILLLITLTRVIPKFRRKSAGLLKKNLSIRRVVPYVIAVLLIYLAFVVSNSGVQFGYALPIAFIITGVLAIKGLKRFAITIPAYTVLIIGMLLLGCMASGMSATTYVPENRYVTSSDAPNINTINLATKSVFGEVRIYFDDDPSTVCHVAFLKEYGPVITSRSIGYHSQSYYETEPASSFNSTVQNQQVNIATSSRSTLVNITISRNCNVNLTVNNYMGDIAIYLPTGENPIQTTNYTTTYGSVRIINP
jgi:hypothetical protein